MRLDEVEASELRKFLLIASHHRLLIIPPSLQIFMYVLHALN